MRKSIVSLLALALSLISAIVAGAQTGARPDLEKVGRMTDDFLSSPDVRKLSHDAPLWAEAVESYLAVASDSAVDAFRPASLSRFDMADGTVAWCALWSRAGSCRLVWFAVSKAWTPASGMADFELRHAGAFVDDIGGGDSLLSVSLLASEGLEGIAVRKGGTSSPVTQFVVPDVASRLALRTLTSLSKSDDDKQAAESFVRDKLSNANDALSADLSGFPEVTFCDSPDGVLRTVTYMVSSADFSSHCGGWVVTRRRKGDASVSLLSDATSRIGQPEQATLNPSSWYGAIYSDIIQFRYDRTDYYALVGFKGASPLIKTRVLDVASVSRDGDVVFGAKVFVHPKMTYRRRVFQYSAKASMQIHYDEKSHIIVMDHLEPTQRLMVGHTEFYGPDLSYDAYVLTDDGWQFQQDIQVTEEDGATPNEDDGESPSDDFEPAARRQPNRRAINAGSQQPFVSRQTRTSGSSSWSGRSSQSSRRNKSSSASSWFDKGKGNSAPNIRGRR